MRIRRAEVRWWRPAGAALTSCVTLAGLVLAGSPTASAAQTAPDACPAPFPVDELQVGMAATGLTVERGVTPDEFSATILGIVDDGIAPGVDMIIAETASPAIDRAGGIWAGMSGSPVYAPDGRLIGAVAYGFSTAPSPIAGLTPAADMMKVLDRPSAVPAVEGAEVVKLPSAIRSLVMSTGEVTSAQAAAGLSRLPLPVAVSGLSGGRLAQLSDLVGNKLGDIRLVSAGAKPGVASTPADIFPGGNFAAAQSYGDVTFAGVGTTTAVCGGQALAFGHPYGWTGASTLSAHPASAVFVQRDNTFGSFKVANPLGVVGTVDQDRQAAIRTTFGAGPATVPVTSQVFATDDNTSREGLTEVTDQRFLPDIAISHLLANLDTTIDRIGPGTADLRWAFGVRRASGAETVVSSSNRYASQSDISIDSIFEVYDQLSAIQNNPFERLTITNAQFYAFVASEFRQYTLGSVRVQLPDGRYVSAPTDQPLKVVTGSRLNLRVALKPYQNVGPARQVDLSVVVPPGMAGGTGWVDVFGGPGSSGTEEPSNIDQLLKQLRESAPNDTVSARLSVDAQTSKGYVTKSTSDSTWVGQVVVGERSFPVKVVAAPRGRPAVVKGKTWKLRSSLSTGEATRIFNWGDSSYQRLMGDWNGDGKSEPALFRDGRWKLRSSLTGTAVTTFTFGQAGDIAVAGDWNGDGRDEIGLYRRGRWLLRTGLGSGSVGWDFRFSTREGWRPVVGDWDGDGIDTVGVFRFDTWRLRNDHLSSERAHVRFTFGKRGDAPVVGDWNGDGKDTIGLYRDGTWLYRNRLVSGTGAKFNFGGATSRPVVWH